MTMGVAFFQEVGKRPDVALCLGAIAVPRVILFISQFIKIFQLVRWSGLNFFVLFSSLIKFYR
jgi:hypothetical protein